MPNEVSHLPAARGSMAGGLQGLAQLFLNRQKAATAAGQLARGAADTLVLKVAYLGLSFILSVILARWLGTSGYGAYAYAMAWVVLLVVPATMGFDNLLMRDVAAYVVQSAWSRMRGLLRQAYSIVLAVSFGLALLSGAITWAFLKRGDAQMLSTFWIALPLLPLMGATRLTQAALQGLQEVGLSQLPGTLIHPLLLFILVAGVHLALPGRLAAPWAMAMNGLAAAVALVVGAWLLHHKLPSATRMAAPAYQKLVWVQSILPLVFLASMGTVYGQTDILLLGAIRGARAVGVYGVAHRGAELISFFLMTVNPALGPTIASLYAAGDMKQLQHLITKSARITFFASLPAALAFTLFGRWFLLHFFGPDYARGQTALAILSVGQLVNVGMGSVGYLLIMTGHEADAAKGFGISALVSIFLNAVLIPKWGLEGAATAAASSVILWNILLAIRVYQRLGIHATALGRLGVGRNE